MIRVESEETQDYVREPLNMSQEEAEEMSFVPSATSIPRWPVFWCDKHCSDKALRFWQFASAVVEDGEEVHTVNLCQHCRNESLTAHGLAVEELAVEGSRGKEGALWKTMENAGKRPV